jgi:hypothetical protein
MGNSFSIETPDKKYFRLGKMSKLVQENDESTINRTMGISLKVYNLLSEFNRKNSGDNFLLSYNEIISMLIEYWNLNHKDISYINYSQI